MNKRFKVGRFIVIHLSVAVACLALITIWRCPFYILTSFPCPGCGLTRAHLALLRLDFSLALRYHPLFPVAVPAVLYAAHRRLLKKRLGSRAETVCCIVIAAAVFTVYIIRIINRDIAFLM